MSMELMHSAADVLRQLLVQKGEEWPVYTANEPPTPDSVITAFDTGRKNDGRAMVSGERFQHHLVQVRVRAPDHPTGFQKAQSVQTTLSERVFREYVVVDQALYLVQNVTSDNVMTLGRGEAQASRRHVFTVNCAVSMRRVA